MKNVKNLFLGIAAVLSLGSTVAKAEWQEIFAITLDQNVQQTDTIPEHLQAFSKRLLRTYEGGCYARASFVPIGYTVQQVDPWGRPLPQQRLVLPLIKTNAARSPSGVIGDQFLINNGAGATVREIQTTYRHVLPPPPPPGVYVPAVLPAPCVARTYIWLD